MCRQIHRICLLLQQCWEGTHPGNSFFQPPTTLPTSFPVETSEGIFLPSSISRASQHCFLSLAPHCWSTVNDHIHQNYSTEVKAPWTTWSVCTQGPGHLPFSTLLFPPGGCGCWEHGPFFSARGCHVSLDLNKPAPWLCSLSGQSETVDIMEAAMALDGEGPEAACTELCVSCLSPGRPPSLWLPGEPLPGWGEETVQEDGQQLDCAGWLASRRGWVSVSWKGSPSVATGNLWSPTVSGLLPEPIPAVTRRLFNHPGTFFKAADQMETIKFCAEKKKNSGLLVDCCSWNPHYSRANLYLFICLIWTRWRQERSSITSVGAG